MISADASVVVASMFDDGRLGDDARRALDDDARAPQLLVAEVMHATRRLERAGVVAENRAADVARALRRTPIKLYGMRVLTERMWSLRTNLSMYDAAYVALAELLECALVTADRRLAGAAGLRCDVRVIG